MLALINYAAFILSTKQAKVKIFMNAIKNNIVTTLSFSALSLSLMLSSNLAYADTDKNTNTNTTKAENTDSNCPACSCPSCETAEATKAEVKNFTGSIQLGALISTGDTEEFTENGAFNFKYLHEKMTYTGLLSALYNYSRTEDDHNERYQGQGQAQYAFTEKNYTFINTNLITDSSDGYDYLWESQVGYGRRLINNDTYHMTLDAQAGPGYRIAPTSDENIKDEQETLNATIIYNWQITEATSFTETLGTSYAESDTITTAKTTLTTKIYKSLGLQFVSTLTNHSSPAQKSHKTNTYSTINLIYGF